MFRHRHAALLSFALASFVALSPRDAKAEQETNAPARSLRAEECVAIALANNVDVLSSNADVDVAEAERSGTRGQFGPKIHADGSYQRWNSAYVFDNFPIHGLTVWNITASITQPITPLFAIYDLYKVRDLGVDVAEVKREAIRRETAFRVVESYYRLLQAERLAEVASASVDQLNAQLKRSTSFHVNGMVSQDDVLRAQLAVANAQQRLIQVHARVSLERSRLATLMGMRPDTEIEGQPLASDAAPVREAMTLSEAETLAEHQRVELREVDVRIRQSDHDVRAAYLRLAPQVSLVGAYIHNEGSLFSQVNAAYVGGVASWDVWDWGTTTSGVSIAKAKRRQADLARSKVDDRIRFEVRQAFVDLDSAADALNVAQASVKAAEENFRLVKKRYEASAATSFDVIDAEGLLTQARGQMQTALYDFVIARASLRLATGASVDAIAHP